MAVAEFKSQNPHKGCIRQLNLYICFLISNVSMASELAVGQ